MVSIKLWDTRAEAQCGWSKERQVGGGGRGCKGPTGPQ